MKSRLFHHMAIALAAACVFLAAALLAPLPATAFTLFSSQLDVAVAPSFDHTPIRVGVSSDTPGFDVSALQVSSSAAWVIPTVDSATSEIVLSFDTKGLITQANAATISASAGAETGQVVVTATVSPLVIVKLKDDPKRSRVYGIHQNGVQLGSVVAIDPVTGDRIGNVTAGRKPCDLAFTDDGLELLVINSVDETISVIDAATLALKETIALPAFENWGQSDTTADIGVGPGSVIYYTDGAWAPALRVLDRNTRQILQTNFIEPGNSYGFGGFEISGDRSLLFGWAQYGWSAGWAGSYISKFTVDANGLLTFDSKTNAQYPTAIDRDPLDTPVLVSGDDRTVFVKELSVDASDITLVKRTFPDPLYSISPGGEIAVAATAVYEVATGSKLADLPRSVPVQAITSDYARLVYYDDGNRQIGSLDLLELIGPGILTREIVPADGSITLSPERLEWSPVPGVDRFRVYLGESELAVAAAGTDSASYLGEVAIPVFSLGGPLTPGITYYWRVDSVGEYDVVTGEVSQFTVSTVSSSRNKIAAATVQGHRDFVTSFDVSSTAPGIPWHAAADQPWVTFTASDGVTPSTIEVHLNAFALAAGVSGATITISNGVELFTLPVALTVEPLKLTRIASDSSSSLVYGISENTPNSAARAYLLEIDAAAETVERVLDVGTSVTDIAVHIADNRIYVTNWMPGSLLAVDRTSFNVVHSYPFAPFGGTGYGEGDVFRISAGSEGRLVVEEEDQWIDISLFDTTTGATLDTTFEREGGGRFDPTGRYYYHGDNNISNAEIHKYDVVGDQFFELAHVRVGTYYYYGSRTVVVSEDGSRVFWNGAVFDADLNLEWEIGPEIYAATADGRYGFGQTGVYDVEARSNVASMPVATMVSAWNTVAGKLVVQAGTSLAFYGISSFVVPPNVAPSFVKGADQTVLEDAGAETVSGWATGISAGPTEESSQALDFLVTNDNNSLFAQQPAVSATGTLTFRPAANASGSSTVSVRLHDNGGTANGGEDTGAAQSFTITVTPVNDSPAFSRGGNITVAEDAGAQSFSGWATGISRGPANESGQVLDFIVTNNQETNFAVQPALSADGTLSFTPASGASGSTMALVRLHDDGGTANGGVDTSAGQNFTITVTAVNDPPTLDALADLVVDEDAGEQTVHLTGITAGPDENQTLTATARSSNVALVPTPTVTYASPSSTATLRFTPVGDASGSSTITVTVSDGQATNNIVVRTFVATVNAVNDAPTDICLSNVVVPEGAAAGTLVGTLSTADPDDADAFTYSLAPGAGDNGSFEIVGNELRVFAPLDFNAQNPLTVHVISTDLAGAWTEKAFAVSPLTYVLWTRSDNGRAVLWQIDPDLPTGKDQLKRMVSLYSASGIGAPWLASSYAHVSGTEGYVLWTRSDTGGAALWQVDPSLPTGKDQLKRMVSLYSTSGIGAPWQATSYAHVGATEGYVLWTRSDTGRAVLWQIDPSLPTGKEQVKRMVSLYSTTGIGAPWQATSYTHVSGTEGYVLWTRSDNGRAVLWQIDPSLPTGKDQLKRMVSLYSVAGIGGPWQASSYTHVSPTEGYVLWTRSDNGRAVLWQIDPSLPTGKDQLKRMVSLYSVSGIGGPWQASSSFRLGPLAPSAADARVPGAEE